MTAPSIVRIAKPEDHQEIWRLFLMGHRENGQFPLAPDKVDFFLQRALNPDMIPTWDTGPRGTVGVIGPVGALEGCALVFIGGYWYTHSRHLEEFLVYVDPECRSSGHARAMVEWLKHQTDLTGLPLVTGIISNVRTEAKVRLYERMGLPKVGAFFLYGGKGAGGSTLASSAALALS